MAQYTVPFVIGGREVPGGDAFDVVSPGSGQKLHRYGSAGPADVEAAVDAAAGALPSWRGTTPAARRDILLRAADIMARRGEELSRIMMDEVGAGKDYTDFNMATTVDMLKDVAGRICTLGGSLPQPQDPNTRAMILREPYGVVLALAPWNAPYILGMRSVLFPIAAGCTVVLKGSEKSPRSMHSIVSVLQEAGLPSGVLNLLFAAPARAHEVTSSLVAHPQVRKVNFTGSTAVGRIIGRIAGEHLKPLVMELGGKAPAIVWEDADLNLAARQCALGSFFFSGQICMSTEKILVHRGVSEAFQRKLVQAIDTIFPRQGDAPVLIAAEAVGKVKRLVRDATDKGAAVVYGDPEAEEATSTRMRPVVLGGVTPDMDIYRQESFGPSVSVIEVETEEQALRLANDSEYGLSSAVFTEDLRRGLRLAGGIESGAVHINNMTVHDESTLPHGGAKASGFGRFNNSLGLDEWLKTKTVTWKSEAM